MKKINRSLILAVCFLAFVAVADFAEAQAGGRISGKVEDQAGNPIEGVQVTATSPAMESFILEKVTNKKGKFVLAFTNSAARYVVELEKEGYKTLVARVNPVAGRTETVEYVLMPATGEDEAAAVLAGLSGAGRAIVAYNEGVEAQNAGDLETAAKKYAEAATINPELAAAHTSMAAVAHLQGDYATAAAEAEKALAIEPTDVRALQLRFDAYRLAGNDAKAAESAEALKEFGAMSDTAARIFNEGAQAYNSGDKATALAKFEEAANLDPTLVRARLVLATLYLAEGSLSEALSRGQEVLKLEPGNIEALKVVYDSSLRLNDTETAALALDGLAESDPEWAATGLFEVAVKLYNNDQTAEAAQALERVLKVDPDHARAHYLLGVAQFNSGDTASAVVHLNRFIELAPDDPDVAIAKDLLTYAQ